MAAGSIVWRRPLGAALLLFVLTAPAQAHDTWIKREKRVNAAGEWCCNQHDCFPVAAERVKENGIGFALDNGELIPYRQSQVSGDHQYWICKRPNNTTRCFFFPPPGS